MPLYFSSFQDGNHFHQPIPAGELFLFFSYFFVSFPLHKDSSTSDSYFVRTVLICVSAIFGKLTDTRMFTFKECNLEARILYFPALLFFFSSFFFFFWRCCITLLIFDKTCGSLIKTGIPGFVLSNLRNKLNVLSFIYHASSPFSLPSALCPPFSLGSKSHVIFLSSLSFPSCKIYNFLKIV